MAPDTYEAVRGVFAPVVTPFTSSLEPDVGRFLDHCRWLLDQNCGLAVFGTNSEAASLSSGERIALLDQIIDCGLDPARMLPGVGACSLIETSQLASHAVRSGTGGVLMLPPFYYGDPSEDGLFAYFSEVIQRVGDDRLQIYLYHIPAFTHVPITLGLIGRLLTAYPESVVGIKDSSGSRSNLTALLQEFPGFQVFVGSEMLLLENLRGGGSGCISATANLHPAQIHALWEGYKSEQADDLQRDLGAVRGTIEGFPMIAALKAAMAHVLRDPEWNRLRPPLKPLTSEQAASLSTELDREGFSMPGWRPSQSQSALG